VTAAARRYARAVFELAQEDGQVPEWEQRLSAVRDLLSHPGVSAVLTNPTIAAETRMALISSEPSVLDLQGVNLAKLLIESNRVRDVDGIVGEFDRLADQAAGRVRATVTTAIQLTVQERERVADELSRRLGQEVKLDVVVDPRILGGMKLQYGDRLVDASISTKLQQLRRRLASLS
jgi:F-type H+-transporting ATPase subunit delta